MVAIGTAHEIQVEAYRGPLDLLLYLVKDEEVDIYDIPIARILERYLEELGRMTTVDINAAADFLLMAATLMEIKSRQMLPPEERVELDLEDDDPRADLVRQLLEYRHFRQAADELGARAARRARLFGRARFGMGLELEDDTPVDPAEELREVEVFDLMATFEALMKSILADAEGTTIYYDDISVEERIEELVMTLRENSEALCFADFSRRAADRADAAGIFAAILEATRRKLVTLYQPEPLGQLYVSLRGDRVDSEFAPPSEDEALTGKKMTARHGVFKGFMDLDAEDEDLEFAFDAEGRKAIARLEGAVERADEAIRNFTKPKPKEPPAEPEPVVRQWTGGEQPAGASTVTGEAPPPDGPQTVVVRQWTDPNRYGQVVVIGGRQARLSSGSDRPSFGRGMLSRRMERGRITGSRIAGSSIHRRVSGVRYLAPGT
jgi:segregation and condensation protein A